MAERPKEASMTPVKAAVGETSKQVGVFMGIMKDQPLSLALVIMNFALIGYLFYAGSSQLTQRQETAASIIKWQQDTDRLMASCVSADVIKLVLDAMQKVIDAENRMRTIVDKLPAADPAPK